MNTELATTEHINLKSFPTVEAPTRTSALLTFNEATALIQFYLAITEATASPEQAKTLANVLIGSYPKRQASDPEIYARAITSIFTEYNQAIGKEAVDKITRTCKFLPTRAEVFCACENILVKIRTASRTAQEHLDEHKRRADEEKRREAAKASWGTREERGEKMKDILRRVIENPLG